MVSTPKMTDSAGNTVQAIASIDVGGRIYAPVTKADADLAGGVCNALLVGTAGTANLMQEDGTIRANVPVQAGYNPLICKQVRTGGTAADIWAIYA